MVGIPHPTHPPVHPHMRGEHTSHNLLLKKEKKEREFSTDKNR